MVPEARLEATEHGLVPEGEGWLVLKHVIVGAGDASCLVLAVGVRGRSAGPEWGAYSVDEAALRHGAGVEHRTTDAEKARAIPPRGPNRYRDGWLPE